MIIITPYHAKKDHHDFGKRQKYLTETISSIDEQNLHGLTHIIVDDGSTDNFCDTIKNVYTNTERIWLRREKPSGEILTCTNALNFGIKYILDNPDRFKDSELITFIHSDDLAISLGEREDFIIKNNLDFMYSDALIFFDDSEDGFLWEGLPINTNNIEKKLWVRGKMPYITMTWKLSLVKDLIKQNKQKYAHEVLLDPHVGCGEDVDLAINTLKFIQDSDYKGGYLPEITAAYRIHGKSLAEIRDQKVRKNEENSVLEKHFGRHSIKLLHIERFINRPWLYFPLFRKFKKSIKLKVSDYLYKNA